MLKILATFAAAAAASLAVAVGTSSAAPVTPSGLCGAANMTNEHALPGMLHAMSLNDPNGDAGMFRAVANSACA